jgi:hypothetical protein
VLELLSMPIKWLIGPSGLKVAETCGKSFVKRSTSGFPCAKYSSRYGFVGESGEAETNVTTQDQERSSIVTRCALREVSHYPPWGGTVWAPICDAF